MIRVDGIGVVINHIQGEDSDVIKIPLTNGALQSFAVLSYDEDENGELSIVSESLVGLIDKKEIWINVIAYDEDEKVLSRSIEAVKVKLKEKNLNDGERLIKDGKIEEGYKYLLKEHEKDPNNIEYMYPLMRIAYYKGDTELGDKLIERLEAINNTGFDEAMKSYYQWLEKR